MLSRHFPFYRVKTLFFALTLTGTAVLSNAQELIWSDEFNQGSLNPQTWNIETGTGINGNWGTGQLDRATDRPENIHFLNNVAGADGGVLAITTRNEFYIDRDYTSGRINTQGKVAFGPGTKLSARVWPRDVRYQGQGFAFWLMPNEIPPGFDYLMWPQGGEIDIMEYVGSIPFHNLGTVHYAWFWEDNLYQDWNHGHQGGYYSFKDQQVPDDPEWLGIDLGQSYSVNQVQLHWEGAFGKSYLIQMSNDGANWQTIYDTTSGDGGLDVINAAGSGRYIRMYGTERGTDWSYSLFEMEVYANGVNVALGKPTTASSLQASDLSARLAVDGEYSTRWSSALRNPGYGNYPPLAGDPNAGSTGFHTYSLSWYSDRLEWDIDGNVYHVHYLNDGGAFAVDGNGESATRVIDGRRVHVSEYSHYFAEWFPFEHEFYIILSAGVGGPSGYTYGGGIVPEAQFPVSTLVDWVRVYNLPGYNNPGPTPPPTPEPGGNLAAGKPAVSSSAENPDLTAARAFDSDPGTRWASTASDDEWIYVDLGRVYDIERVELNWETAFGQAYRIEVSDDASVWSTVYSTSASDGGIDSISLSTSGRYVRLYGQARATGWGYSLWEFEVYGSAGNGGNNTTDYALNQPVTVSSAEGDYWFGRYAVDGDPNTRWASDFSDDQWIYVDLGSAKSLSKVVLNWEAAYATEYQLQISDNATTWTTVANVNGIGGEEVININGSGRYVRMLGVERATGYGYSLWNFEVY